ncbi:MAG: ABC transporter ATP-binding protein [Campylobacterales bacterium]
MGSVLEIDNISFSYGDNEIFRDFSLSLSYGEIVSVVGASGSGKSTLFELISGELTPDAGTIKRDRISFIFQDPYNSFSPTYSILNQIEDVALVDGVEELLEALNLERSLIYKKPFELSGGELQRCSILRALLMKPNLILADEPTSALDNITSLDVMKLLLRFLDRSAILLVTHDLDLAKWCSDRVVEIGEKEEV